MNTSAFSNDALPHPREVEELLTVQRMQRETPDLTIRHATVADAHSILKCLAVSFEPYKSSYTPAAYQDTVLTSELLSRRLEKMTILVAVSEGGTLVGTIAYQRIGEFEGHLRGMAVLHAWQGLGIAAKLLAQAELELRKTKCSRISLDTTEPLALAMRFYEKHGYRRSGKTGDFFDMRLIEYIKNLKH